MARTDMLRPNDVELANKRGEEVLKAFPRAVSAHYDHAAGRVVVELSSKLDVRFRPRDAQGLENAKPLELEEIEISPSGLGLHFPQLDADLYIPALLEGFLGSQKWMAARLGQTGGRSRSRAKKTASRVNGKLGGRPRNSSQAKRSRSRT